MRTISKVVAAALVAAVAAGCSGKAGETGGAEAKPVAAKPVEAKPAGAVKAEPPRPIPPPPAKLSASHILVMHKDSVRPDPAITRTKEEALKRAEELYAKATKPGADFAAIARESSDCPSGKEAGGDLGVFVPRQMAPEFSKAVQALSEGEISRPVETPFGYHVIRRQKVEEIHARHILVMHEGSKRKPAFVTRTKDEARALIDEIAKKLEDGGDFAELAREHSDCPTGKRAGGDLGTFTRGRMAPPFEQAAFALDVNRISGVVETDFGFHLIQRLP